MVATRQAQHFDSIEDVLSLFEAELTTREVNSHFRVEGIDYLWTEDGTIVPSFTAPFSSPYLYRGQVSRFQPCLPSVFRGLSSVAHPANMAPSERLRCFVDRVKLEEFVFALDAHPASGYAREIGLRICPHALAQHYELATDRIDLTQDHKVAAFFATNTRKDGVWLPVNKGVGVLYRLQREPFRRHFRDRLECIGKQVLPRPGEQKAHTLVLPLGRDFESLPVEIYTFSQRESYGRILNDHFGGGAKLFPPDVMSEIASAIKSATTLPRRIVTRLFGEDRSSHDLIAGLRELKAALLGQNSPYCVSEREPIRMTSSQQERAATAVETLRATFLDRVDVVAVRNLDGSRISRHAPAGPATSARE